MVSHSDSNQPTKSDLSQSSASASLRSSFSLSISRYSSSVRSQASVSALTCRSRSRRCCALRAGFRCLSISQRASPDPVFYTANDLPYSTVLDLVLLRGRTCSTPPRPSRGRPRPHQLLVAGHLTSVYGWLLVRMASLAALPSSVWWLLARMADLAADPAWDAGHRLQPRWLRILRGKSCTSRDQCFLVRDLVRGGVRWSRV